MKKSTLVIMILMLSGILSSQAQCFSHNGIMNATCSSMTIVTPPAFDVSIGMSNTHIFKFDLNYITKDEIVYGASVGFKPFKTNTELPNIASINGFIGYNVVGCIIIGCTAGVSHALNYSSVNDVILDKKSSYKSNIGMSVKFISAIGMIPVTIGGYASNAGIGMTVGTIF